MPTESKLHRALYTWVYPLGFIAGFVGVCWWFAAHVAVSQ